MTETTRIIAWLRTHPGDHARVFADAIERGEHLLGRYPRFVLERSITAGTETVRQE